MVPSDIEGRGLVKIDNNIYEFQTAYPYKWDEINTFIKNICNQLNEKVHNQAGKIAILPNHVRMIDVIGDVKDIRKTPIGIEKDSLQISHFDFGKSPISLVSAQDITMLDKFIESLGQVFQNTFNVELIMVDANDSIKDKNRFKNYYSDNLDEAVSKLEEITNNDSSKSYIYMIFGVEAFISAFDADNQRKIKSLFSNIKNHKNVRIIFADSISKIKMYEYEDFFRNCVQPINAVWVGSGITDQFTVKCSTYNKETRSQIPNDFGYNVDRGNATQIKLLDFYTEE